VLRTKERTPTLFVSIVFTFGLTIEFIKEFEGASQKVVKGTRNLTHRFHDVGIVNLKWKDATEGPCNGL
jgi:hypothetical protein